MGEVVGRRDRGGRHRAPDALGLCAIALLLCSPSVVRAQVETCSYRGTVEALSERPSPLDSVALTLGGEIAKLCYGRPSTRGRFVVGAQDPYGAPWRLGANEPTTLHLPFAATIGGVEVAPGSYSLYAIPEPDRCTIVVNRNTARWGIPIDVGVRADDVGSFTVPVARLDEHVETLEFTFEQRGPDSGDLVYSWERATLSIPVRRR